MRGTCPGLPGDTVFVTAELCGLGPGRVLLSAVTLEAVENRQCCPTGHGSVLSSTVVDSGECRPGRRCVHPGPELYYLHGR